LTLTLSIYLPTQTTVVATAIAPLSVQHKAAAVFAGVLKRRASGPIAATGTKPIKSVGAGMLAFD
jgi:hypothetical protein